MEKTVNIAGKSVRLNNNIGWAIAYRDQFGQDIIPSLLPLLAGALDLISGLLNSTAAAKGTDEVTLEDVLSLTDGDTLFTAVSRLAGLEFVDFINIVWALAKAADSTIPEPKEWVRQFDAFPVDELFPEVFRLIAQGVVSSKNLERLKKLKSLLKGLRPAQILTHSSSQDSNEA